jgi:hypothetical protein
MQALNWLGMPFEPMGIDFIVVSIGSQSEKRKAISRHCPIGFSGVVGEACQKETFTN